MTTASQLTVKVHPLVYMTMVDSFERRKSKEDQKALGTLLGFYEKNVVQVEFIYRLKHYPIFIVFSLECLFCQTLRKKFKLKSFRLKSNRKIGKNLLN